MEAHAWCIVGGEKGRIGLGSGAQSHPQKLRVDSRFRRSRYLNTRRSCRLLIVLPYSDLTKWTSTEKVQIIILSLLSIYIPITTVFTTL